MLVIRDEQLSVLGDASLRSQVETKLRRLFPDFAASMPTGMFSGFVGDSVARARRLGLDGPEALGYASLEIAFGQSFSESPDGEWAARILGDASLTSAERMDRLRDEALARLGRLAEDERFEVMSANEEAVRANDGDPRGENVE
jgi:hypothetical protein